MAGDVTECRHGIEEAWCGSCKGAPAPAPLVLEGVTRPARFSNKCPGCGDPIIEGEDVHLTDGGWVCTRCAERAVQP